MNPIANHLLNPRSVAVIGASDNPNKVGGRPIYYMRKHGYRGRIFPVNPGRETVQGLPCHASLDHLPEVPDAVVIAVDGSKAVDAVRQCADRGVPTVIVITAGFSELGDAGRKAQEEMVAYANARGTRVMGPNSLGIANFATGAILSFSTMYMEVEPKDGPIALIGQSGASCVMPYSFLREAGMGARYLVGSGNDADLCVAELVRMVSEDAEIKLILAYLETVRKPELLAEAADIARSRGAGIVLLKGGSSERGALAAASHTGAMAGNDAALDAFLQRHGIWRARDMRELINAAPLYLSGCEPGAGKTVIMSHSGGWGVMCADVAGQVELPLAELSRPTCDALSGILPSYATATNPLDLTAALLNNKSMFADALQAVTADPQGDMFLVGIPVAGPGYDLDSLAGTVAAFAEQTGKPFIMSASQSYVREACRNHGLPVYLNETDALHALRQYWAHHALMKRTRPVQDPPPLAPAGASRRGVLNEAESLRWLDDGGVPVVQYHECADAQAAMRAFDELGGGKVVVKGCTAAITHKSEHNLVHVGLQSRDAVRAAAQDCLARLAALNCADASVIVAPMIKAEYEFVLGVAVDPVFGALVMIGDGGKLVEVRNDVVTLLAPFTQDDVKRELRKLRIAPLLDGYRDMPALDIDAVARAAVKLGDWAGAQRDRLRSVDINPLMVGRAGEGAIAVDAVVEFQE
jgi:acyl-CoA synthetase (NDP forming)